METIKTYYIDALGDDSNDGLSQKTPWKSFAKINQMTLNPGDSVRLKSGCVWNEELVINGKGTEENFIEITSYGAGNVPKIERDGEIWDRCMRVNNASFISISNLEVCNGGAGIVLFYDHSFHNQSVYLDNICAHDFYGIYRGCGESSKNEKWQNYVCPDRVGFSMGICVTGNDSPETLHERVLTDLRISNCEVYKTGGGIGLDWCDHKCCDKSEASKNKFGDVLLENLNLHDNDVPDVSLTSLFLQCVTNAVFRNSVIDVGAGGAPWGTAAVHIQLCKNVLIENVTIKNMPHTDVDDECGLDFETDVENCIVSRCTFENNAGPAIEFLANFDISAHAMSRGIVIIDCTFLNNNWAALYTNPAQILTQKWRLGNRPEAKVWNCVYSNPEGVSFIGGDGDITKFNVLNNIELEKDQLDVLLKQKIAM